MKSHLIQTGLSVGLASVEDGISKSVVSMSFQKALSLRAVELALRDLQSTEGSMIKFAEQTLAILVPQDNE